MSWANRKSPNFHWHRSSKFSASGNDTIDFIFLHEFIAESKWCLSINTRSNPPETLLNHKSRCISYRVTELDFSLVAGLLGIGALVGSTIFDGVKSKVLRQIEKEARRVSTVASFSAGGPRMRSITTDDLCLVSFLVVVDLLATLTRNILIVLTALRDTQKYYICKAGPTVRVACWAVLGLFESV